IAVRGGVANARRVALLSNHSAGLLAALPESEVVVEDLLVRESVPVARVGGFGITLDRGAILRGSRIAVERCHGVGVFAGEESRLEVDDLRVEGTSSWEGVGRFGRGVEAQAGAEAVLRRVLLDGNRDIGLLVLGSETSVQASATVVQDTERAACATDGCGHAGGYGVSVRGGLLRMEDFVLEAGALCGAQLGADGTLELRNGRVVGHPIGLNVQNPSFDPAQQLVEVAFEGNERNLDAASLPLPEPIPSTNE
ncbi:MAG: hypothetical protein AAGF12_14680, partial [Myxococcota bacterium]